MAAPGFDETDPYGLLVACLDAPESGKSKLPRLVSLFESDERVTRLCAAWACCVVANEIDDEDAITYLVRRLSDRLGEEHVSLELTTTLDYLSARYPEQVETVIDRMSEEEREREGVPLPRVGNFTRSNYYSRDHSRDGVGRTRIAGEGTENSRTTADAEAQEERGGRDGDDEDDSTDEDAPGRSGPMAQERTEVTAIADRSRFDKLHILATRERNRYADTYEALVGTDGEEAAVTLRLLHEPSAATDRRDFRITIEEKLAEWERVATHPQVVSVLDWGVEPRPWVATAFTGESLSTIDGLATETALDDAITLADAVTVLHRHGVVHGGIDPENVIYPNDIVESGATASPFLDNVGILEAFRFHFQPSLMLDPRFAAPEYFDEQYGRIGPATDVYQTGAVIYYMFTGQPPFSGQFAEVRKRVLGAKPPAPSAVAESVPDGLDSIVSKALAKQKITRYETAAHLEQELVSLRGGKDDG